MTSATLEQARNAKPKLAAMLQDIPEVRGIGIAILNGGFGLKVNLSAETCDRVIPTVVDGVPVITAIVGAIRPAGDPLP